MKRMNDTLNILQNFLNTLKHSFEIEPVVDELEARKERVERKNPPLGNAPWNSPQPTSQIQFESTLCPRGGSGFCGRSPVCLFT